MMRLIAGLALIAATPAAAQAPATVDYSKESSWLCLPGRADVCGTPLATVDVNPSGYGAKSTSVPA
jgi:hypothetical protein